MQKRIAETEQNVDRIGWRLAHTPEIIGVERQLFFEKQPEQLKVQRGGFAFEPPEGLQVFTCLCVLGKGNP